MQVCINTMMGRGYDATPAVALIVNKDIYLFNTPPLIYRACLQNNIKFKNIKAMLLTSNHINSISGLHTICESLSACSAKYQIIGPSDLTSYLCHNEKIVNQELIHSLISSELFYHSPSVNIESIQLSKSLSYTIDIDVSELRMNSVKMKELNLPPGPWIAKVRVEGSATVNGKEIKKEDIFFIKSAHFKFLFLDIQDPSDLQKIPNQEELQSYDLILHFTSPELFNEEYFSHFANSHNYCFLNDPIICLKDANDFYANFTNCNSSLFPPLIQGHVATPPKNFPTNFISLFSNTNIISSNNFKLKPIPNMPITTAKLPEFDTFALTFSGSGGAYENPTRSCSSYLLHTHQGMIIIDCGNGFIQQLKRKYGLELTNEIVKQVKCIWISHHHYDHLLGIYDFLLQRKELINNNEEKLLICCDQISMNEIKEKEKLFGNGDENLFNLVFNDRKNLINTCGVVIESAETTHCEFSMGCVITFENGKRLAFTGDMLFDGKFSSVVKNCDILLSEATYPKSKESRCATYQHMSNEQAEQLQNDLNASYLIMIHTSNAYSPEEYVKSKNNAIYGFDYLCITDNKIDEIFSAINSVKIAI